MTASRWGDERLHAHSGRLGVAYRMCDHGLAHPDPEDRTYALDVLGLDCGSHVCDGCCHDDPDRFTETLSTPASADVSVSGAAGEGGVRRDPRLLIDVGRSRGMFMVYDAHGVEHFLDLASGVVLRYAGLALGPRGPSEAVVEGAWSAAVTASDQPGQGSDQRGWVARGDGVDAAQLVEMDPVLRGQPMRLLVRVGEVGGNVVRRLTGPVLQVEPVDEPPWVVGGGCARDVTRDKA